MKALAPRKMRRQVASFLPSFALAGNLLVAMSAMANEDDGTFRVEIGHLSENVRVLVNSHG